MAHHSREPKGNFRRLGTRFVTIVAMTGVILALFILYISAVPGNVLFDVFSSFLEEWLLALILIHFYVPGKDERKTHQIIMVACICLFMPPVYYCGYVIMLQKHFDDYAFLATSLFRAVNLIKAGGLILYFYHMRRNLGRATSAKSNEPTIPSAENPLLNRVIDLIRGRAVASTKMLTLSLTIMIILVLAGGAASVGTIALNEVSKVRQLEAERVRLLTITDSLQTADFNADNVKAIQHLIKREYGDEHSYHALLEDIQKQSLISWPDIALRITIAVLTLFLVQVFFHIYKYNQQESAYLFSKAEILELFDDPEADKDELRKALLARIETAPKFGRSPKTPTEQIINILERVNGKKEG